MVHRCQIKNAESSIKMGNNAESLSFYKGCLVPQDRSRRDKISRLGEKLFSMMECED